MTVLKPSRIREIFAESQYSTTAHKNLQNQLKKLHQSLPEDSFFKTFTDCLKVPLMCGEKTSPTERTLDFAINFIASFITKKVKLEGVNDDDEDDELPKFVNDIFIFMCENAGAENQIIRFRICQFLNKLLNALGNDAAMDDDLCDLLCDRLMERLRDKSANVRTQAVRALYRLQDPTDVNCRVTSAFIFHLSSDPSADVRGTILTNIAISNHSVRGIVERTRDTNETVRKVAFLRIAELNIQRFSIEQRVRLLERGLKDQSEKVRKCVTNDLLRSWFDFHKENFVAYLHALDCEHSTETSTLSLETMFNCTKTGLTTAIKQIQGLQGSDKLIPVDKLIPENVLLWKVVTKYLESHPEVAEERPVDEPLEDLVPELSTFCTYILKYFDLPPTEAEPWVHAQREYILGQLLEMCEGFDLADEMGRANLRSMCQSLLLNNDVSDRVVPLLVKIMVQVIPDLDDRLQCLAEVIAELHDPSADAEEPTQPPAPQMSAEEKRQLEIKEAKIKMKLNELTEDQDEAAKAKDYIRAQQLLDECQKLKDELKALTAAPAPAPAPVEKAATQESRTEEMIIKDKGKLQKCLCIVKEMMQPTSVTSLVPTLRSLMHNFVMPCLRNAEDPVIKNMALEAMGLFCLLDTDLAKQHFVFMFCFQIANDELCETALKVTFDLLHLYGLETFEIEECKDDDEVGKKRSKKKKNLFVTDTLEDEFDDEDDPANQTINTSRANTANLIGMLTSLLGSTSTTMRNLAMKGLCKLLLACRMTSPTLLSRLIVMWYSPVTDGDEEFRQPTAAFLKALATGCPRGQEMLEQAFLPTLKTLREAPADSPLSEVDMESVTKLFLSLTRPGTNRFHKKGSVHVHNSIAVTICNEILNQEDSYFDECILLRSLLQLELCLEDPVFRQDLQKFIGSMRDSFQMRGEKALLKYVDRFEKMVEETAPVEQIACPEVDNTAQTEHLNGVDNTARTDQLNGADNTTQTYQLNITTASVVKKSRRNAKILKRGEADGGGDSDEDSESDTSVYFERNPDSQGTIIPESPRLDSPSEVSGIDVELEDAGRQPSKRRKMSEDIPKEIPKEAVSPKKAADPASKSKVPKRKGEGRISNEEPQENSPPKKAATEESDGRRVSRSTVKTVEQVKETGRGARRAAKNSEQVEEASGENLQRESRSKRKPVEVVAEPTKKKPADKASPAKKKRAPEEKKTTKVLNVVLDVMEISEARPRREIKLTAKALAFKENLRHKSPTSEKSSSPSRSPETANKPPPPKNRAINADIASPVTSSNETKSVTESQSDSSESTVPAKRTRRSGGVVDSPQKSKPKRKAAATRTSKPSDASSSDEMFSSTPPPSRSVRMASTPASPSRQNTSLETTSPVATRKNTRNAKKQTDSADPERRTRSGSFSVDSGKKSGRSTRGASLVIPDTDDTPQRASRSKSNPEEAAKAPVTRRSLKAVSVQVQKLPRAAKTTVAKRLAAGGSSSSDETSSPERRALRPKAQSQQSSSSTDSPLPASSSSGNTNKPTRKVVSKTLVAQPSSSDDSPGPEAVRRVTREKRPVVESRKSDTSSKDSHSMKSSRLSNRDDVIQRVVDRVRRSVVLSTSSTPTKDTPASRSSRSSSEEFNGIQIIQRAVDRVRRSAALSQEASSTSGSSSTVVRKLASSSTPSNDSPAKSSRSGSSQEETGKRTLRAANSKDSPLKTRSSGTPQNTPGRSDKNDTPSKQAKSDTDSSASKGSSSTKSTEKVKAKTSLGRRSSGRMSSPSVSTRSNDLVNKLRARKRL